MKLHELHVDQFRARFISQRETIARRFPTVARNFVSAANPAGSEHDRFRPKNSEPAALAFVTKGADDTPTILEQRKNRGLHTNLEALVNAVRLGRSNHFQTSAVAAARRGGLSGT